MWRSLVSSTSSVMDRKRSWITLMVALLIGVALTGCGRVTGTSTDTVAPAGLIYGYDSVVYAVGQPIEPNAPSSSGGAITQYSVAPALPVGLNLDAATGVISGTPSAVADAALYTVTATNSAGHTTARLQIEVRQTAIAPETLRYRDSSPVYSAGVAIVPNHPVITGGEITRYRADKPLPTGLSLDPATGVISGTPATVTASAVYTVTGSNSAGSVTTRLTLEVRAAVIPPASLSYSDPAPVYRLAQPVVPNAPSSSGGEITQYSIAPPLPAGLSLNTVTGEITGTATEAAAQASYTVMGANSAGVVSTIVSITVVSVGAFTPTDNMAVARAQHTATLLPNGKVLVVGGADNLDGKSSAELYDPITGRWSVTGSLATPRHTHTATLLPNGKVLVAGGADKFDSKSSAELYDPITGTWSATGSMAVPRYYHSATLLPNGKVLVAGGFSVITSLSAAAELYDPSTGTWSATGSMAWARGNHSATLLPDGKVLVAGGSLLDPNSAELYDPITGIWSATGRMGAARLAHTATLLAGGKVLVTGGRNKQGAAESSAELYDSNTGIWSTAGSMPEPRYDHTATLLSTGKVLVAGGANGPGSGRSSAEVYDPDTGIWSAMSRMAMARYEQSATLMPGGKVLVAGGANGGNLSSAELYEP